MDDLDPFLQSLRKDATSRRRSAGALGYRVEHPRPFDARSASAALVAERWPEDAVVEVDLPTAFADQAGPCQAILRTLLKGDDVIEHLNALRRATPHNRTTTSYFQNDLGMDASGAQSIARALEGGDFDAVLTLTATEVRESTDEFDPIHVRATTPLLESQARVLVDLMLDGGGPDKVRWIVMEGAEGLVSGASTWALIFRRALKRWLRDFVRAPGHVLLLSGWSGAVDRADAIEPTLRRRMSWGPGTNPQDAEMWRPVDEGLLARGLVRLSAIPMRMDDKLPCWWGVGEDRAVVLHWGASLDDPARLVPLHLGSLMERISPRCAAVVPDWALGERHAQSRTSLTRAYRQLHYVGLSQAEACALMAHGEDFDRDLLQEEGDPLRATLEGVRQRLNAAMGRSASGD